MQTKENDVMTRVSNVIALWCFVFVSLSGVTASAKGKTTHAKADKSSKKTNKVKTLKAQIQTLEKRMKRAESMMARAAKALALAEGVVKRAKTTLAAVKKMKDSSRLALKKAHKALKKEIASQRPLTQVEVRFQIDDWEIRERAAYVAYAHVEWKKYTRAPKLSTKKVYGKLTKIRSEKKIFETLKRARKEGILKDPVLKHRAQMLWDRLREFHLSDKANALRKKIHALEDKLNGIQASHRAVLGGKKVSNRDLRSIIRRDPKRSKREQAWRAYATVGPRVLKGGFMKLVRARNAYAKSLGFPTYFHYRYSKLHLHPEKMWKIYEKLRLASEDAYLKTAASYKELLKIKKVYPWDRRYAAFYQTKKVVDLDKYFAPKKLLPILFRGYKEMGFALKQLNILMDLYPRPGKNQHAYCFDIDPPYDVRILANVGQSGLRAYETMFHEMGHAVHGKFVRQDVRTFRALPDEGFLNEGSANFFGNLVDTKDFFQRYLNIPKKDLQKIVAMKKKQLNSRLYTMRWTLLWMYFERDLYINANVDDPTSMFWARYRQFQGDVPPNPPPYWGILIHFVSHPIYYQNYLLADMLAAQLHEAIRQKTGAKNVLGNPKVGPFLKKNFFAHGRRYRWDELLKKITGKPLTADAYLRALKHSW
tara:strand:- start:1619 stop:3565 length:1947 start_codon:yes stop_codon:yes gene_type:complete